MRLMSYVRQHRKTGVFWYRRAVPKDVRGRLPRIEGFDDNPDRVELTKTLRTKKQSEANRLAGALDVLVEAAIAEARNPKPFTRAASSATVAANLTPASISLGLDRWVEIELEKKRIRVFNGDATVTAFEQAASASYDTKYKIQQYSRTSRSEPDLWKEIAGFDDQLVAALVSVNVHISSSHPALPRIRPYFAAAWDELLRGAEKMEILPSAIWEFPEEVSAGQDAPAVGAQTPANPTAFDAHFERWKKTQTSLKPRQMKMYAKAIQDFARFDGGLYIETLSKRQVQRYAEGLIVDGGPELTTKTVRSRLAALRSYWHHLQSNEDVGDAEPFRGLRLPNRRGTEKDGFSPEQVVYLWRSARDEKMDTIADLIKIAAFTGGRIEAMCALKAEHVRYDPTSECWFLKFEKDKTFAGRRDVPIHSALSSLITRLEHESSTRGGYLIPSSSENQYRERSPALGKAFGRFKTKLGFGRNHTFHSFRHTVAKLFELADVKEGVAADILGHRKPTMTFGLYAGATLMSQRKEAVEVALNYPSEEFVTAA